MIYLPPETIATLAAFGRLLAASPSVSTYSAAGTRTPDDIAKCAHFLSEVVRLGAGRAFVGVLEDVYWAVLDSGAMNPGLEALPLFASDVRLVDQEAVKAATSAFAAEAQFQPIASEFMALVDGFRESAYAGEIEDGVRNGSPAVMVGPLLRAAVFIKFAIDAGVPSENRKALAELVLAKVMPEGMKTFTAEIGGAAAADEVRRQLGLSEADLIKHSPVQTMSAPQPGTPEAAADQVRHQLGISKTDWDKLPG
jgi:hypothetical protein